MQKTQKIYLTEENGNKGLVLKEKIILEEISKEVQDLLDQGKFDQAWNDIEDSQVNFNGTKEEAQKEVVDAFLDKSGITSNLASPEYKSAIEGFFGKKGFDGNPFTKYFKEVVPNGKWDYNKLAAVSNLYYDKVINDNDLNSGIVSNVSLFDNNSQARDIYDLVHEYKNFKNNFSGGDPVDSLVNNPGLLNNLKVIEDNPDRVEEITNALKSYIEVKDVYETTKSKEIKEENKKLMDQRKADVRKLLDDDEITSESIKDKIFFSDNGNDVRSYQDIKKLLNKEKSSNPEFGDNQNKKTSTKDIEAYFNRLSKDEQDALVSFVKNLGK